jgi:SpoVK/Ycf46/Vps4 family AAA+-type ATPase
VLRATHLIAPSQQGGINPDTNALALLVRDWSTETLLTEYPLATFLATGTLNDLHPLLARNPRAAALEIPLPSASEYTKTLTALTTSYPTALGAVQPVLQSSAAQLAGASLSSVERLLRTLEHRKARLTSADLVALKKRSVELESEGLIEFLQPERTLDDLHGQEGLKKWLRQDLALWSADDVDAIPKGYLLCGPVGTGKTFMVECLAGEASVPIVKLKNFRDMWVGSTEGNLEKIFRLVHALGKCMVFVDEADQALGRRQAASSDSGTSGRVYGMIAEEMGSSRNRGRIVWVLASSRPDLIEVDLKRPGRIDVKIPILPTSSAEEGFELLRALCKRRRVLIEPGALEDLRSIIPDRLTPGAAEALAVKAYRLIRTESLPPFEALRRCLEDYRPAIPPEVMELQIQLALDEASDASFIPPSMRVNAPM